MTIGNEGWFTEEWPGEKSAISLKLVGKLHEEKSRFQRIEVFETETFGKLLTLDGLVMVTDRDNFIYHEMLSHPALFTHSAPEKVLIVGGGDCGTLREVLKHPEVKKVHMVEIDERVTRVSEQFFPDLCSSNADPRVEFHFEDGIRWVQNAADASYDVIIVDGSDPEGPAAVLFSEDFFHHCHRALTPKGVMVGQSESPLFHLELIKHYHRTARKVGFGDVASLHFHQCTYPSGWWTVTVATKEGSADRFREQDAAQRPFKTSYYTPAIHRGALAQPAFVEEALK
jgi:spermidine synthase